MNRDEMRALLQRGWERNSHVEDRGNRVLGAEGFLNMASEIIDRLDDGEMTDAECKRHAATKPKPPVPPPKGINRIPGDLPFNIWVEGYLVTGMEGMPAKARCVGTGWGETFSDAVRQYVSWLSPKEQSYWSVRNHTEWRMWGCIVTSDEAEARSTFG